MQALPLQLALAFLYPDASLMLQGILLQCTSVPVPCCSWEPDYCPNSWVVSVRGFFRSQGTSSMKRGISSEKGRGGVKRVFCSFFNWNSVFPTHLHACILMLSKESSPQQEGTQVRMYSRRQMCLSILLTYTRISGLRLCNMRKSVNEVGLYVKKVFALLHSSLFSSFSLGIH